MNGILFKLWKLRTTKIARKTTYDYRKNIKIKKEREREREEEREKERERERERITFTKMCDHTMNVTSIASFNG